MMRLSYLFLLASLVLGCATAKDSKIRVRPGEKPEDNPSAFGTKSAALLNASPYEHIHFQESGKSHEFTMRVLELDDNGVLFDPGQIDLVRDRIVKEGRENGALIVVFVHGWKHNGTPCDDNLSCFRQVLKNLTVQENSLRGSLARRVTGVYIGWRGLAQCNEPGKELSFWRRKHVAHSVGASQAREILQNLRDAHEDLRVKEGFNPKTRLVIVGHSFGAAVVFSALENDIRQEFLRISRDAASGSQLGQINGFGDLVVLINPAFEAQHFKDIRSAVIDLQKRGVKFHPKQPPILAVISSEKDVPTHLFFPVGQAANLLVQPLRLVRGPMYWLRHTLTVGNHWRYWTHHATQIEPWRTRAKESAAETPNCYQGPPNFSEYPDCSCSQPSVREERTDAERSERTGTRKDANTDPGYERTSTGLRYGNVALRKIGKISIVNNPFLVISAASEVSSGHTDVFNPTLVSLLEGLVMQVEQAPTPRMEDR